MKIQQKQIAVIILVLYIKSCQGKEGCQRYWDPNEYSSFIMFDEQGYEGITCKEYGTEDTVGQCPNDKVRRVKKFSEHALEFVLELDSPAGYERIHGKKIGNDDTDRKYLSGKAHIDKNSSAYSFTGMVEQQCPEGKNNMITFCSYQSLWMACTWDITLSLGKASAVKYMNKIDTHDEDFGYSLKTYKLSARFVQYSEDLYLTRSPIFFNISLFGETGFKGPSISVESDVTTSAPTKLYIVDTTHSSGENSYIEWTQVIHTGSIIIFIVIITAVSISCVKCYVDRRLRTLNRATENEHEPLHNHNGATYIPMEDLNVNQIPLLGELQESDHNGNVNSSPESPERHCESETEAGSESNDSCHAAGPFCRCCGLHWTRCKKRNKEQRIVPVQPQQSVNEMPSTETVEVEVLVDDGYSNFSSSIFHHPESHGSTSTDDEETTHVKSVYSNEQVSSTVEQTNEAEGTCFEESQQADLHNEDHMTTGN